MYRLASNVAEALILKGWKCSLARPLTELFHNLQVVFFIPRVLTGSFPVL